MGLCAGLVVLLGIAKPLLDGALGLTGGAFTLAVAWQLFIPLDRLDRRRINPATYGIHAHGILGVPLRKLHYLLARRARVARSSVARRLTHVLAPYTRYARWDGRGLARDLGACAAACAVTFPPFVVGYVLLQQYLAGRAGQVAVVDWSLPADAAAFAFTHLVVVAGPEELFYRGYIHTLLVRAWPPRWSIRGVSLGMAVIVGCAWFAAGHFIGEWNPARLGPFFPALMFCALRGFSGSIFGAVVYHGLCNILGEVMRVSVHWQAGGG